MWLLFLSQSLIFAVTQPLWQLAPAFASCTTTLGHKVPPKSNKKRHVWIRSINSPRDNHGGNGTGLILAAKRIHFYHNLAASTQTHPATARRGPFGKKPNMRLTPIFSSSEGEECVFFTSNNGGCEGSDPVAIRLDKNYTRLFPRYSFSRQFLHSTKYTQDEEFSTLFRHTLVPRSSRKVLMGIGFVRHTWRDNKWEK